MADCQYLGKYSQKLCEMCSIMSLFENLYRNIDIYFHKDKRKNREVKKAPPQFPKEQCDGIAIATEGQSRNYGVSSDRYAPPHRKASLKLQSGTAVSTLRAEPRQDLAAFAAIVRTRRFKRPLCPAKIKCARGKLQVCLGRILVEKE